MSGTMRINEKDHMVIGGADTVDLAWEYGTPLYVLDEACSRENCRRYRESLDGRGDVAYAGKTLLLKAVCRIVEKEGLIPDAASGGEPATALAAGFPPARLYFHGNSKTPAEIRMGVEAGVGRLMVDSLREPDLLEEAAG